jgi:hypothetical protein
MDSPVPWIGLLAIAAMFLIDRLPPGFWEGPRRRVHWPVRDVCGECGQEWERGHQCQQLPPAPPPQPAMPLPPPVRGELRRVRGELRRRDQ